MLKVLPFVESVLAALLFAVRLFAPVVVIVPMFTVLLLAASVVIETSLLPAIKVPVVPETFVTVTLVALELTVPPPNKTVPVVVK